MKKENKNNYYKDEDEIIFEKLCDFKKFNSNIQNNTQYKNHNIKYSNSDKNYFNNIIKTEKNDTLLNKSNIDKETGYYNSSDFQKFNKLNSFQEYKDNTVQENNKISEKKIVKVVDFNKENTDEKKTKIKIKTF